MGQQQRHVGEDATMAWILIVFVIGLALLIWFLFREQLVEFVRWVRWAELWAVKFVAGDDYSTFDGDQLVTVGVWRDVLFDKHRLPTSDITTDHIRTVTMLAVPPLRYIFAGGIAFMGLLTLFFGPNAKYRRRLTLETLMREQARSFPAISPFLKLDPRKMAFRAPGQPVPVPLPMFSEALSPEEWIAYNEIEITNNQIDRDATYKALVKQLGKRWDGPKKLPIHAQGLFAACALKHVRKRKECEALMNEMVMSWSADGGFKPSMSLKSKIKKIVKDPKLGGALQKFADQHAWETTAMLRCLSRAREEGGVLAPAEFVWLRGHDRALWYPLNNLGRRSYHPEAAGAMVHYTNELIAGQKIPMPRVEDVIRGLDTYLKSGNARDIPPLERATGRKKRGE